MREPGLAEHFDRDLDASLQAMQRLAATMPSQHSSTAQDMARGKRSEIDHLNGTVVRRGAALGVPTPVNQALHALVKLVEAGRQALGQRRETRRRTCRPTLRLRWPDAR